MGTPFDSSMGDLMEHLSIIQALTPMALSPFVLVLLAVCWVLPAVLIAVRYAVARTASGTTPSRIPMEMTTETVRIRGPISAGAQAVSARDLLRAGSYADVARTHRRPQEERGITRSVPYAEASVHVLDDGEPARRRCSVCMN